MFRLMLCVTLLVLAVPALAYEGKIKIHPQIWSNFEKYLNVIGSTKKGAFAVAVDGRAMGAEVCPSNRCKAGVQYSSRALERCEQAASGVECVVFAKDREIQVEYEVGE